MRIPFGSLRGPASHTVVGVDSCPTEDSVFLAGVTLTVCLTAGIEAHLVDKPEVEGGSGEGKEGGGGRGREGCRGRRDKGGEGGRGRGGTGGLEGGEGWERAKGLRIRGGGRGGGKGGGDMFGGWGGFFKMFLLVSIVNIQLGVSLLRSGAFRTHDIEGESSKGQSAGEMMTSGSDLSSTVLETVGRVENVE